MVAIYYTHQMVTNYVLIYGNEPSLTVLQI